MTTPANHETAGAGIAMPFAAACGSQKQPDRLAAGGRWRALLAVGGPGPMADLAWSGELRPPAASRPPDRALATELCFGAIRQRRRLDACSNQLGQVRPNVSRPNVRLPAARRPLPAARHPNGFSRLSGGGAPPWNGQNGMSGRGWAPVVNGVLRAFLRPP